MFIISMRIYILLCHVFFQQVKKAVMDELNNLGKSQGLSAYEQVSKANNHLVCACACVHTLMLGDTM